MKDEKVAKSFCNQIYLPPPKSLSQPAPPKTKIFILLKTPSPLCTRLHRPLFFGKQRVRPIDDGRLRITFKTGELTSGIFRLQERDEHLGLEWVGWLVEIVAGGHVFHQKWDTPSFYWGDQQKQQMYGPPILCGFLSKIIVHDSKGPSLGLMRRCQ